MDRNKPGRTEAGGADVPSLNVLFIGNSFTARNDLPGMVSAMATADGRRLDHRLISVGGASLRTHWNKGEAVEAIRTGGYHRVVLQEQSTLPVKNPKRMHENVRPFDEAIRAAGARTVLYLTWARRHAPQTQRAITDAYSAIAAEFSAAVIPAGIAWERFLKERDHPVLHDRDGSHPTTAGTFLAACTAYAVLFGRSPVGILTEIEGLTPADIETLQQAADA